MTQAQKDFIGKVGALATADMERSGILASLTLAQAILESGWGTSALAVYANALFGIKADSRWAGRVYSTKTQECYDGVNLTTVDALFRAYDSWTDSLADHSAFLIGSVRYAAVIGEKDYKKACAAIHAADYATDPGYADKLIRLIEQYKLTDFDIVSGKEHNMNLRTLIFTKNACYKAGRTINVKGIVVHSIGANNPNLCRYVGPDDGLLGKNQYNNHWNQDKPDGRQVCVHAFIGKLADGSIATYQTLPWNHRGWHGGSGSKLDVIINRIYEDHVAGKLSDERFNKMLTTYESEQSMLTDEAKTLRIEIEGEKEKTDNIGKFLKLCESYTEITELSAEIARTFIEKIVVHEAVRAPGHKYKRQSQQVDIHFTFIGEILKA